MSRKESGVPPAILSPPPPLYTIGILQEDPFNVTETRAATCTGEDPGKNAHMKHNAMTSSSDPDLTMEWEQGWHPLLPSLWCSILLHRAAGSIPSIVVVWRLYAFRYIDIRTGPVAVIELATLWIADETRTALVSLTLVVWCNSVFPVDCTQSPLSIMHVLSLSSVVRATDCRQGRGEHYRILLLPISSMTSSMCPRLYNICCTPMVLRRIDSTDVDIHSFGDVFDRCMGVIITRYGHLFGYSSGRGVRAFVRPSIASTLQRSGNRLVRSAPDIGVPVRSREPLLSKHMRHLYFRLALAWAEAELAAVAERLACSPPTKVNRVNCRQGHLQIFVCWNRAGEPNMKCEKEHVIGMSGEIWAALNSEVLRADVMLRSYACIYLERGWKTALWEKSSLLQTYNCKFTAYQTVLYIFEPDNIDVKHVYTEVDFAIRSHFFRHALNDSESIADSQGNKGSGGAVARALASHHGDPDLIPGGFLPGFSSHVGTVLDDVACRRVFTGYSRFPRPCIPAPLHPKVLFHAMSGDDGHLWVPAGTPVTRVQQALSAMDSSHGLGVVKVWLVGTVSSAHTRAHYSYYRNALILFISFPRVGPRVSPKRLLVGGFRRRVFVARTWTRVCTPGEAWRGERGVGPPQLTMAATPHTLVSVMHGGPHGGFIWRPRRRGHRSCRSASSYPPPSHHPLGQVPTGETQRTYKRVNGSSEQHPGNGSDSLSPDPLSLSLGTWPGVHPDLDHYVAAPQPRRG
ncbi:hypothetical protein PR048_005590 [Dryococelus australis]|uniref:Uncharacterized protein n=1 Tax=Dryococelus australis TaxID=614101 RepID=A0ABQ9I8M5_9NEOP|nr:hypothetical protein PR048_005590 [Dryococelus australis]